MIKGNHFGLVQDSLSLGRQAEFVTNGQSDMCARQQWAGRVSGTTGATLERHLLCLILQSDIQTRLLVEVDKGVTATHSLNPGILGAEEFGRLIYSGDKHPCG